MATTVNDLTPPNSLHSEGVASRSVIPASGSLYTSPGSLLPPSAPPTPRPGPTPSMPTTTIPEGWTSSGRFQGSTGIVFPQARLLSIPIQKLAGTTDIFAASPLIQFPFVIRSCMCWTPASTIGASSDGFMDVRVGSDPAANFGEFNTGASLFYPPALAKSLYCPLPVSLGELWIPFEEGHLYILVHAGSLGGATNVQLVCLVGISPLDDYIGA